MLGYSAAEQKALKVHSNYQKSFKDGPYASESEKTSFFRKLNVDYMVSMNMISDSSSEEVIQWEK
jgi:hypothetical protein